MSWQCTGSIPLSIIISSVAVGLILVVEGGQEVDAAGETHPEEATGGLLDATVMIVSW